ncbi:GCN5-related N-acetyltransferase [Minicystis rosea]|nr:GCN5-related N-acetyltransferase [Minicystis rosea]
MTAPRPTWHESPDVLRALNAPLETPRLRLEPLTAAHADAMFAPLQDEAIYRWISTAAPIHIEALRERWAQYESRVSSDGREAWLNWAVRRRSDGIYIGKIDVSIDETNVATNVGYIFLPAFWGQGLATEAVVAVVDHLIGMGVPRLVATVTAGNAASGRLLRKAGFTFTRLIPENDIIRGVAHDDEEYIRIVHPAAAPPSSSR